MSLCEKKRFASSVIKSKDNHNDDGNNAQNKDDDKKIIKKAKQKTNIIRTNKTLTTNKETYRGRKKKNTYLLNPNYEKTTLSNMQHKYHVH